MTPPPWKKRLVAAATTCVVGMLAAVVGVSAAATPAEEIALVANAEPYEVTLTLPGSDVDVRRAVITVTDDEGSAVSGATVVAHATMREMGHFGRVTPASALGRGRYEISGDLFPMPGPWIFVVSIDRLGTITQVTMPVALIQN